ncbi:thioredoxin [Natronolimnohabitans sp. A-GB9]|uniref:thioredoxin n=1 Tax=Natronolimnohabitans sp. A-GB9 TaxID=3069757 RepID=UPI0027B2ADD7|nr:thioredoxin [Natronolimnohabitans sp. A-GB9]MDQ2052101.1 thioredoxin [Natronolimnohabitans sp. A-GB9]
MATDSHSGSDGAAVDEPLSVDGSDHLDEIVDEYDVVLVDFYADWCGPCKMLEPVLERLAGETDGVIAKVDVDANQQLAGAYGVRGVPTLVLFADGEQVEQHTGALPADRLRDLIEGYTE